MAETFKLGKKRAVYFNAADYPCPLEEKERKALEQFDLIYRTLVALLYNYAPLSGHPGGSISCGRLAQYLLYKEMAYDFTHPLKNEADIISYAAGHKALGLYALWALRNECMRAARADLLPKEENLQLRLEDLLGFRRNNVQNTPLFNRFHAKSLGGHPEPCTPFVFTSTGASGVGVGSAVGLAIGAADAYGADCPVVHVVEGEGGLTAGRCSEAISMASTAQLKNVVFHIDWNEASIESECVTADGENAGDYVQWTPQELFYIHDCNVIFVPDGHDFNQIHAAHRLAHEIKNHQPTAIVYRTIKGWQYGLEGKSSHGSGHKFASPEFYQALAPFEKAFGVTFPRFEGDKTPENIEKYYWDSLLVVRQVIQAQKDLSAYIAHQVAQAAQKLNLFNRQLRADLGDSKRLTQFSPAEVPAEFTFKPGESYTTRGVLGKVLAYLNKQTQGTLFVASADLYGSTGAAAVAQDFDKGYFNTAHNPRSRRLSAGGICEDGMAAVCSGVCAFGKHIAVSSSYGAFVAFEHVAARLHAIGVQTAREIGLDPNTLILFNGHASLPTGQDGPTHADPQSLQLLQDNFPKGACITATPLEVDEIWPLVTHALTLKPAVFAPFVVRTSSKFMDRKALGADEASQAVNGVYYLRRAKGKADGTVFVQGAGVGRIIVEQVLPVLDKEGLNLNILYVTSRELFEMLPPEKQAALVPDELLRSATGITDFTLPTLDGWINSVAGRRHALYPHKNGKFLQSADASKVYEQAGMDGKSILAALRAYVADFKGSAKWQ